MLVIPSLVCSQIKKVVNINTHIVPPYSPYLGDYYEVGLPKLISTLVFLDFNESSWDVKLKVKLQSSSVVIETRQGFRPLTPITLTPGIAKVVTSDDWSEYFSYENINVSGMNKNNLFNTGVIPEGLYTFSVEVLDYDSGIALSDISNYSIYIKIGGIPVIMSPSENFIVPTNPQNIKFHWRLSSAAIDPLNTEYQLKLYEVTSPDVDPVTALANNNAILVYESDWQMHTLIMYDASATNLDAGNNYVYTVQVRDTKRECVFKNNGISEAHWFTYAYPTGGKIETTSPENNKTFNKFDEYKFKWSSPDNMVTGQKIDYKLKIIESDESSDPESAMSRSNVVYDDIIENIVSSSGWSTTVNEEFDADKWYAWQIEAYTNNQKVAQSQVYKFRSPPSVESFIAANQEVEVLRLDNTDINNLSGRCLINIDSGDSRVKAEFEGVSLVKSGDVYVLNEGIIETSDNSLKPLELKSRSSNKSNTFFVPSGIRLTANRLEIKGYIETKLPLAVKSGDVGKIISEETYISFNDFNLNGVLHIDKKRNKYELIEPMGFSLELNDKSYFTISDNKYELNYSGRVGMPDNAKNTDGSRIYFNFKEKKNLNTIHINSRRDEVKLPNYRLSEKFSINIEPIEVVIDLSFLNSPEKIHDKAWFGAYLKQYNIHYKTGTIWNGVINSQQDIIQNVIVESNNSDINTITSQGIRFYREEPLRRFTSVSDTSLQKVKFNIVNGEVRETDSYENTLLDETKFSSNKISKFRIKYKRRKKRVDLSWKLKNSQSNIGCIVYRQESGSEIAKPITGVLVSNTIFNSYRDRDVAMGNQYTYHIVSFNNDGTKSESNKISVDIPLNKTK